MDQLRDILPSILLALIMGVIVYFIGLLPLPLELRLMIQILSGGCVYVILSFLLHLESFVYLLNIGKNLLKRKNKIV